MLSPLRALSMCLVLLHHLVNPSPLTTDTGSMVAKSTSQAGANPFLVESQQEPGVKAIAPQGVDLQARLLAASTVKEFSGLQHIFVAALGSIAYCEPGESFSQSDIDSNLGRSDMTVAWRAIQCWSTSSLPERRALIVRPGSRPVRSSSRRSRSRRNLRNVLQRRHEGR
jgi:hypothetical protein